MFKHAQDANMILTWILRLVGVLVLFMGFRMMLTLLEVLASVVPIFGDIVGFGASMIALLATAVVAPIVIAIAWFFYRPLYAAVILAAGMAIFFGLRQLAAMRAASRPQIGNQQGGNRGMQQPMPAGMPQGGGNQFTGGQYQASPQQPQGGSFLPPRQNNQQGSGQQRGGSFLPPGFGKK